MHSSGQQNGSESWGVKGVSWGNFCFPEKKDKHHCHICSWSSSSDPEREEIAERQPLSCHQQLPPVDLLPEKGVAYLPSSFLFQRRASQLGPGKVRRWGREIQAQFKGLKCELPWPCLRREKTGVAGVQQGERKEQMMSERWRGLGNLQSLLDFE